MPQGFDPILLRGLSIPNRFWMSPMCTYSASPVEGMAGRPTDFHLGHYSARAAGGVGLVMVEATGVAPQGRITPYDLGLWEDGQIADFARLTSAIQSAGSVPGIQLAHSGRKGSLERPWLGGAPVGEGKFGWKTSGPSDIAFPGYPAPLAVSKDQIKNVVRDFGEAARRAVQAGFEVAEIHAAHGYLLHSFLSPISNRRSDRYGGSFENRSRFVLEVLEAVRNIWPKDRPVFLRLSTTDWIRENPADDREAWGLDEAIQLAKLAHQHGIDLIDCSSGGIEPALIPRARDYQTANAARIRAEAGVPVAAVGRISDPVWADELIANGQADAVFVGRALLRDASWANNAASQLKAPPRFLTQYAYVLDRGFH